MFDYYGLYITTDYSVKGQDPDILIIVSDVCDLWRQKRERALLGISCLES